MVGEETWLPPLKTKLVKVDIGAVIRFLHALDTPENSEAGCTCISRIDTL